MALPTTGAISAADFNTDGGITAGTPVVYGGTFSQSTCSYASTANDGTNATTYTFTAAGIGTAASDRDVIVCIVSSGTGTTALAVSTVTIGGVSATRVGLGATEGTTDYKVLTFYRAAVPTGTTANIVVTMSREATFCRYVAYAAYNLGAEDTTLWDTSYYPTLTSNTLENMRNRAGGTVISAVFGTDGSATWTWTGLTETLDAVFGATNRSISSAFAENPSANLAIKATPSVAPTLTLMGAVAFYDAGTPNAPRKAAFGDGRDFNRPISFDDLRAGRSSRYGAAKCLITVSGTVRTADPIVEGATEADALSYDGRSGVTYNSASIHVSADSSLATGTRLSLATNGSTLDGKYVNFGNGTWYQIPTAVADKLGSYYSNFNDTIAASIQTYYGGLNGQYVVVELKVS